MSHPYWPYAIDADEAPPLDADRLILWLARRQWRTILGGVLFGVPWMLSIALVPAAIGKAIDMIDGETGASDVLLVATGVATTQALKAAASLAADGIRCRLLHVHTVKPLDADAIVVGSRGFGEAGGTVGSVSEALLRLATRPVLVIPPRRAA